MRRTLRDHETQTVILGCKCLFCRSELTDFGHGRKVFALKFHPFDNNMFITGGWDKCVKVIM